MNKNFIILIMVVVFGQSIAAQTYYYRYTKSVIKGVTNTDVSGGQFITFDGKKCFESDKNGNNVGNGSMMYEVEYSQQIDTYWGSCYWGENAYMTFNADKSLMNIETNAGKKYVYKRATAPAGVTTCSLIRKQKSQSDGGNDGGYIYVPPTQPIYPQSGYTDGTTSDSKLDRKQKQIEETPVHQPQRKSCGTCRGSGVCNTCEGKGWVHRIGMGHDGYCPVCNNHNGRCPWCNGRGEWYE